ncbi:nicotinate phosphoribosyltransferase [Coprinopsis cinerea okayama7|uniref:nicotinate phosphoribosyltransferase n=1 Tax=Coprinopsis cinerea (strain Okayama-7 / 130 / ATCC MYA-4618 / FGSC 9003) TaxID=240176 RepID=A8PJ28_COPC7|nr:nicotinate phosphoribosyltransferase [Coprinopsis cinerea okayama7\|eukprot:XP_001841656.2 nicotinate phosphoribosyltransferase [Coprinopsis cinerea okayama7\
MASTLKSPAVPPSILDTDLYKLTMQQAILIKFPAVEATYRFTNRNKATRFSRQCIERFRSAVARFSLLALTPDERAWLDKTCPYLTKEYLDYLEAFRFKPEQVDIVFVPEEGDEGWGQVKIEATGPWVETILWEVPLMACLSETYFQSVDRDWEMDGQEELAYQKGRRLLEAGCSFNEFGTRRRRSFRTQEIVLRGLVKASREVGPEKTNGTSAAGTERGTSIGRLLGTSNVHLARLQGLQPVGTIAHEWFMGVRCGYHGV